MTASARRLYGILLSASAAGLIWLVYIVANQQSAPGVCLIKSVTGVPCPSCGTTRAIHSLLHGQVADSLLLNPFGVIVFSAMCVIPAWILYDLATRKQSFFKAYSKTEHILRKKYVAIPLSVLVLFNWIWNIYKDL